MSSNSSSSSSSSSTSGGGVEIYARNLFYITFKYTWTIEDYIKLLDNETSIDSPTFDFHVNGLKTKWSLAIRFWTDEDGKRLSNPVVVCLNLVSSISELPEDIEVRYQFGLWNSVVRQYEVCPVGIQRVPLAGQVSQDLISVGYRDVLILERHLHKKHNIELFCKIMLLRNKVEENTLGDDLWNKMKNNEFCDITLVSSDGDRFPVHKTILSCRSRGLDDLITKATTDVIEVNISTAILNGLLEYVYTDRVGPLVDPIAYLKIAVNLQLPGLKNICEQALIDSINPVNVGNLLMIAESFSCEALKKAGVVYVEKYPRTIKKTIAWKVMEDVTPQLFEEVCQSQG